MVINNKRFNRIPNTDLFDGSLTGEEIRFSNTQRILRLLNSLNDKNDKLKAYFKVLDKYQIHSAEKLDKCLMNERVW